MRLPLLGGTKATLHNIRYPDDEEFVSPVIYINFSTGTVKRRVFSQNAAGRSQSKEAISYMFFIEYYRAKHGILHWMKCTTYEGTNSSLHFKMNKPKTKNVNHLKWAECFQRLF